MYNFSLLHNTGTKLSKGLADTDNARNKELNYYTYSLGIINAKLY